MCPQLWAQSLPEAGRYRHVLGMAAVGRCMTPPVTVRDRLGQGSTGMRRFRVSACMNEHVPL